MEDDNLDEVMQTVFPSGERRLMETRRQSLSLGRVVLFTPSGVDRFNGAKEYIAIIGQVWEDVGGSPPYCNLLVFPPFQPPMWEGSCLEFVEGKTKDRTWRWPDRV